MLTLHYSLANPEKKESPGQPRLLGTVSSNMDDTYRLYTDYLEKLKTFSPISFPGESDHPGYASSVFSYAAFTERSYPPGRNAFPQPWNPSAASCTSAE